MNTFISITMTTVLLLVIINFLFASASAIIALYRVKMDKPVKRMIYKLDQKNIVTLNDHKMEVIKTFVIMMLVATVRLAVEMF